MSQVFLGKTDSEIAKRLASMTDVEIRQVKTQCEDNMCSCDEYRGCMYCPYESRVVQLCKAELNQRTKVHPVLEANS